MISTEKIKEMQRNGEWIVSLATWKKWNKEGKVKNVGRTKQAIGCVPVFEVNGKFIKTDWILTYAHTQYEHLIPVAESDIEK